MSVSIKTEQATLTSLESGLLFIYEWVQQIPAGQVDRKH